MPSASIDAEPVTANAANFAMAIVRLAKKAAKMALRDESVLMREESCPVHVVDRPHPRGDEARPVGESQHRRASLVALEHRRMLRRRVLRVAVVHLQRASSAQAQAFVPAVVEATVGPPARRLADVHAVLAV